LRHDGVDRKRRKSLQTTGARKTGQRVRRPVISTLHLIRILMGDVAPTSR
jgi:hypothetical protein